MKRRNPFPGVTRAQDQHGKVRWRFRKAGLQSLYLPGEYGSQEFRVSYERALKGKVPNASTVKSSAGSIDWICEQYLRTPQYQKLGKVYHYNLGKQIERFRQAYGKGMISELKPHHIEEILAKKAKTPSAANELLKLIGRLCKFAIRRGWLTVNPTSGLAKYDINPDGYYTWTEDDIKQFEHQHHIGSKACLAMRLMLYTGAARQDVAAMGWQNIKENRIEYRRRKTGGLVSLSLNYMDHLVEVLELVPSDQLLFITHGRGQPYSPDTFGMWFKSQCRAAGLEKCTPHGLRKAGATRLANSGANEYEIMSFLGHMTPDESRTYVKAANRMTLADSALRKRQKVSNPLERLDKFRSNALKTKEK